MRGEGADAADGRRPGGPRPSSFTFLAVDLACFVANLLKMPDCGGFTLAVGLLIVFPRLAAVKPPGAPTDILGERTSCRGNGSTRMKAAQALRLLVAAVCAGLLLVTRQLMTPDSAPAPAGALTATQLAAPYGALARDVAGWWAMTYPRLSGGAPFAALEGGFVAYGARTGPHCGEELVGPERIVYCIGADYIAWDRAFLRRVAARHGPAAAGAVLAHEYGHAAHQRLFADGVLAATGERDLPREERSADCLAGAWFADYAERRRLSLSQRAPVIALFRSDRDSRGEALLEEDALDQAEVFDLGYEQGAERCLALLRAEP